MPAGRRHYDRKFNATAECWSVFEEVLAGEFENAVLFGRVHQLSVDAYTVQHAGGPHPDKSVCIHLAGLYLTQAEGLAPVRVAPFLQRLAARPAWPHLDPPAERAAITVFDVAMADSPEVHATRVLEWAAEVWRAWRPYHGVARDLIRSVIDPPPRAG